MEKPRVLSGEAIVAKGITKIDASLPEIGLKDVTPNGSWLEQKQVQAALEARKYLIEVERIEKWGTLSHAEWHDDLMLAEVTQKCGGHWQYLGHNVGKTLYLRPEEALYLMEVNALLLKHNEVTVSLQKAYSLLLRSSTTLMQYKVYASLSRLGYKVFKHKDPTLNKDNKSSSPKVSSVHELENIDSPILSTGNNSENIYSQTLNTENESNNVGSHKVCTNNEAELVNTPTFSTVTETENINSPTIEAGNESENVDSINICSLDKSKGVESELVNINELESVDSEMVDTVNNSGNVDSTVVETDTKSQNVDTQIDSTANEVEGVVSTTDSQANILDENTERKDIPDSEANKYITEFTKENTVITQNCDTQISNENESPIAIEEDKTVELKNTDNISQIESVQVSSSVTEVNENDETKTDNMKICTESEKVTDSGIALQEDDDNRDNINNQITTADKVNADVAMDSDIVLVAEVNDDTNKDENLTATSSEVAGVAEAAMNSGTENMEDESTIQADLLHDKVSNNPNNKVENLLQNNFKSKNNDSVYNYSSKVDKLSKRRLKPSDSKSVEKCFENMPDLFKKQVVTINVPDQEFIPKNIYVNNTNYLLNLKNIKKRSLRSASSESSFYTSSDEASGTCVRRIRSSSGTEFPQNPNFFPHIRYPRQHYYRPYGFWRPQNNLNFYQFSMFFQRPSFPNMYFQSRVQYLSRSNPFLRSFPYPSNLNPNNPNMGDNARKRMRSGRTAHLQGIKNLAVRLKQMVVSGNTEMQNLDALHSLLHSYNLRYKSRLRLTDNFDVVNEEKILETIELDDDEESKSKKPRLEQEDNDKFNENLYRLRQLALRLRDLKTKDKATANHRRAFSKAIKTFNKTYNADVYLDEENYEVVDRRCITLVESSSESDCVVEEKPKTRKRKKLRNPFNILKRRSERMKSLNDPGTSKDDNSAANNNTKLNQDEAEDANVYNQLVLRTFNETWLPNENDFGRAEIVPKRFMNARIVESSKEQYLYDFMKDQFHQYQNWLEAKTSFLKYLEETNIAFQSEQARIKADSELVNVGIKPLIDSDDSSDMPTVLEKLRIIKNNKEFNPETSLKIDFDVYNRDVQNFRKTNPPKPHFRIICVDDSSGFPATTDVMALHSKYEDKVAIVFAIVGTGSISYLQINPIHLPIYVPSNDVV